MRDIVNENQKTCLEQACTLEHNGKTFESGGAFIGVDAKGIHGGVVYGNCNMPEVMNWHGDIRVPAKYGRIYRSNMGDKRRHVWFTWKGIKYHGVWCSIDWSQIVRVREIKY